MRYLAVALAAVLVATAGLAQMTDIDMNDDGVASFDELVAAYPDVTADQFAEMDTNGDGSLDADEMVAAIDAGTLVVRE